MQNIKYFSKGFDPPSLKSGLSSLCKTIVFAPTLELGAHGQSQKAQMDVTWAKGTREAHEDNKSESPLVLFFIFLRQVLVMAGELLVAACGTSFLTRN